MIPGEYLLGEGEIEANAGRRTVRLTVANTGDRPIQVGSHFHFFEANRALRFEPGDEKVVTLVELGGARAVYGLNALTEGSTAGDRKHQSLGRAADAGFQGADS